MTEPSRIFSLGICLLCLITVSPIFAEFHPWDHPDRSTQNYRTTEPQLTASSPIPFYLMLRSYQTCFSSAASAGCPSHPSCSRYMQQAIAEFGPAMGVVIGIDRLIHEGDEIVFGRSIVIDGNVLTDDPIFNNTFWFHRYSKSYNH